MSSGTATGRVGEIVSGRYRIDRLLGEGGMGAVYLAEHMLMRKRVALKVLRPEMIHNAEAVARFEREAVAAAHIDHPNVVAAMDCGKTDDGLFFLALEYVEGTSLREVLSGPLPPARVIHITRQIALALDRAHEAGIIHRDLKPENVMLLASGEDSDFVKVLDFGIAKVSVSPLDETQQSDSAAARGPQPILTKMGEVLGTPEYMSPEQSIGDPVGPPSDLYALGIVMFEMLTGVHPFNPPNRMMLLTMHVLEPVPPMKERAPNADVPEPLEAIVRRLLEKEPRGRFAKALDVVRALDDLHVSPSSPRVVVSVSPATPPSAPESRRTLPAAASPHAVSTIAGSLRAFVTKAAPKVEAIASRVHTRSTHAFTTILAPRIELFARRAGVRPRVVAIVGGALVLLLFVAVIAIDATGRKAVAEVNAADGARSSAARPEVIEPPPKRPTRATKEQIEAAARNPEVLEELARQFPADASVLRELVLAYDDNGRTDEALRTIASLCALQDKPDSELLAIVVRVATNGKGKAADDAFALLEGPLGAAGVDALIEMSRSRQLGLQRRATGSLAKPDVRAHATPAAAVFLDLRAANTCQEKHDLLGRTEDEGDARILPALRNLRTKHGCGFLDLEDCWSCLRNDRALDAAIDAVTARRPK